MRPLAPCLILALCAARPAAAAAPPLLFPTHDVTLTYAVTPQGEAPLNVRVAVKAGGRRMRITSDVLPTALIVDRDRETADIMLPMMRMYSELHIARFDPERTVLKDARFAPAGQARVAGRACTEWHAEGPEGRAEACITPDGLILRGSVANGRAQSVSVTALTVQPGPVPVEELTVPPGYQPSPFHLSLKGMQP